MSIENAKRFIEAASQDQALQQKLSAAREPAELVRLAVEAGSERGLPFTEEELEASIGPRTADGGGLSEDQLESVAGGTETLSPITGVDDGDLGYARMD